MKIYILLILIFNLNLSILAQDVQWANEVLSVSSEFIDGDKSESPQYKAIQVLGKPNSIPGKQSPCAWSPKQMNSDKKEFIIVGFAKMMKINQLIVNENYNSSSVVEINVGYVTPNTFIGNQKNVERKFKKYKVYQNDKPEALKIAKLLVLQIAEIDSVNAVEVIMDTKAVPGFNQIDAIGIRYATQPYNLSFKQAITLSETEKAENLGKAINSEYQEITPTISPDGKTLYFTRSKHPENTGNPAKQDIWYAELQEDGIFSVAKNVGKPLNTPQHNSAFSILNNQKMLLNNIYKPDNTLERGLSLSEKKQGKWTFPKEVEVEDYYNQSSYSEYFMSNDEQTLLMTVARKDSYGGKDIYVSFRKSDGTYSKPKNLGHKVNTAYSEVSPILSANGKTLFFSSGGYLGYGSSDIYMSRRLDDTWQNWSEPINLGSWINSSEWDAYISVPSSGEYIYFSSYKNTIGDSDIFRIKLSERNYKLIFGEN